MSKLILSTFLPAMLASMSLVGTSLLTPANAAQQPNSLQATGAPHRALLDQYCVACHNDALNTAELSLDGIDVEQVGDNVAVWETVAMKLRAGAMPPVGVPRPDPADHDALVAYLETELDRAAAENPNPGRSVIRRLNRTEYSNAIRDLLAIDTDAVDIRELLPPDESAQGFDNIGSALSVSPLLMERYLASAQKVVRIAIGDPTIQPVLESYDVPKYLMQDQYRMSEDLPFGSRGGISLRHHFPVEGDYVVQVRLQRMARQSIRGLHDEGHEMEIRLDGERVSQFQVGGEDVGAFEYFKSNRPLDAAQEEYERTADEDLEIRVHATAGTHLVGVSFQKEAYLPEGPLQPRLTQIEYAQFTGGLPAVGEVIIGGPYNATGVGDTPSRRKIFVCNPDSVPEQAACAKEFLSNLARRAYRRPVTDEDVEILLGFYEANRSSGGFEAGIEAALERLLLDPEFLFKIERDPEGVAPDTAYSISDLELASRLSFFLWSSIPDEELLSLAEQGRLSEPEILEQQVVRMLGDTRANTLVSDFAGQWLLLRNLSSFQPDPEAFPYFDDNLRDAFQRETELFVDSLLHEDRSVTDLLDADYTYLNERLARHYGIAGVYGSRFRRVSLSDEKRKGLLGHGSILMATSYPKRTAPTLRGKWILENILGAPPPPPPPDIPALMETGAGGKALTMREQMQQHTTNPSCSVCHARMDPLGFALENYDAIGLWRSTDGGSVIDATGELPGGEKFQGPAELRQLLLSKREQFVGTVTERLLTYALGRELEYYDGAAVRRIIHESAPTDYRWSALILNIVKSSPFQMRRSRPS
jgi:mono/diheme cytochrome c family protein